MKEKERAKRALAIDDTTRTQMYAIAAQLIAGVDVTEIYSPRRVVEVAEEMGLRGGLSLDLTTGWDFDREEDRDKTWEYITRIKPLVVIGSPMCTMFSQLQNLRKISEEGDRRFAEQN